MVIKCVNMFSCHFTSMKSALKPSGPQLKLIPFGMKLGMKWPAVSLLSPECDDSPSQGPHSSPPPPPRISSGFPNNLPTPINTPEWREALWEYSALPKNTTHWPCQVLDPDLSTQSPAHYVTRVEQRETSELTCCDAYRSKVQFLKVSWSEFFNCFMPKKHFSSKSICYSTHSYSLQYINFSSQTYILRGNNIRIHTINVSVWVMTKNMLKIGS